MTISEKQQEIVENFGFFEDWSDKYAYLISLSKGLDDFPEDKKDEAHMVKGCQSQVWFDAEIIDGRLHFKGISDAAIVSGLIALLIKVYSDSMPSDIVASNTDFMQKIGLDQHLSATRNNGLHAMVSYIYNTASAYALTS
ncbi:MAG: SufE family protein [Francisellaceae bacterium]